MDKRHPLSGPDYVGRKKCGCYTVWISGETPPAMKARWISRRKREGYEVCPCRTEWARENVRACHCEQQANLDFEPMGLQGGSVDVE